MNKHQPQEKLTVNRIFKKLFLSAFVVTSFGLYALEKPPSISVSAELAPTSLSGPQGAQQQLPAAETKPLGSLEVIKTATPVPQEASVLATETAIPTQTNLPKPTTLAAAKPAAGLYKDGTYNGPEVNAVYGLVRVQTIVQNGKIADVKFLEFPQDRRTLARINSYAVPYLQQEAIQAQNAQVNFISGATLTSEAFVMSLQSALDQAKN